MARMTGEILRTPVGFCFENASPAYSAIRQAAADQCAYETRRDCQRILTEKAFVQPHGTDLVAITSTPVPQTSGIITSPAAIGA